MGFFKRKFEKNAERDFNFLKGYASRCMGLLQFAEGNSDVQAKIHEMAEKFQYTDAISPNRKKLEKDIEKQYAVLESTLQQPGYDSADVINQIKIIINTIVAIASNY